MASTRSPRLRGAGWSERSPPSKFLSKYIPKRLLTVVVPMAVLSADGPTAAFSQPQRQCVIWVDRHVARTGGRSMQQVMAPRCGVRQLVYLHSYVYDRVCDMMRDVLCMSNVAAAWWRRSVVWYATSCTFKMLCI